MIQGQTRQHSKLITLFILFMASQVQLIPIAVPQATIAIIARTAAEAASLAGASHSLIGEIVQNAVENFRPVHGSLPSGSQDAFEPLQEQPQQELQQEFPWWPQQEPVTLSLIQSLSQSVSHSSVTQSVTQSISQSVARAI